MPHNEVQTADMLSAVSSGPHWMIVLITLTITLTAVVIHYEVLQRINLGIARWRIPARLRVLLLIFLILTAHVAEIWLFGITIFAVNQAGSMGGIAGPDSLRLLDAIYLSATTFTTVGYGDLYPVGPIRMLLGTESVVGFVLVTWSASFTFLEMQRFWKDR